MRKRVAVSWSGGKDSALALREALRDQALEVAALVTTVNTDYDRISIHGVRTRLLRAQADRLALPLFEVPIPAGCTNEQYEAALHARLDKLRASEIHDVVFGDLFLQDIRDYRETMLQSVGMTAHFPVWERDTAQLARTFINDGFRARIVCVDPRRIAGTFCGREFDEALLNDLPDSCDPCGERGEFHTFVYDAPMFSRPIHITNGVIVERAGFVFQDM